MRKGSALLAKTDNGDKDTNIRGRLVGKESSDILKEKITGLISTLFVDAIACLSLNSQSLKNGRGLRKSRSGNSYCVMVRKLAFVEIMQSEV